jgi:spore germination protein YaaH
MQVLQPEPIVVAARPVSANLPVLQPISLDKLSTIDRARSQYHNQARTSSTSTTATSSFAARSKSNVPPTTLSTAPSTSSTTTFDQEQDTKIFLTDVAVTPTIEHHHHHHHHHNGSNSNRTPVGSNDTAAQLTLQEETTATRDTNETKEAGKTPPASPRAPDSIEGRMSHVEETQNQMRAELEKYLQDVRTRTNEEGTALVDFPESFDKDSEQATNRESSWRKFISDRVRNHPDGELDRKTQQKL